MKKIYDVIVVGAGAAGMLATITAANNGKKVLLLEKLSSVGKKLKATGGGRCNLTNTLKNEEFMKSFGKQGRFMREALESFDYRALMEFFESIGVKTHIPDGFRVFPVGHNSQTIISALKEQMQKVGVKILCQEKVKKLLIDKDRVKGVECESATFFSLNTVIATGGLGYPSLGGSDDGYTLVKDIGHSITPLYPAMLPLKVKEDWVKNCRADTIAKATIKVDIKKAKGLSFSGDLIFTKDGIRGPVVLDFAREITPLLEKYNQVPLLINMVKGLNQEQIYSHFKSNPNIPILEALKMILPESISCELSALYGIDTTLNFRMIEGVKRDKLIKTIAWTPLTVVGHDGFEMAMITRGGVSLKEIDPKTMQSKLVKGLYFCGEVVNLDGPCGGYNLQWSFSSGFLVGKNTHIAVN